MASNAGPGGSPNAPAGQPADDDATGELVIDVDAISADVGTATAPLERPGYAQPLNGPGPDVAPPSSDDTHPNGRVADTPAGWPAPPPALRADGWDAESTAAWDPASSWAVEEDEEPEEGTDGPWDEVPNWEGEIVTWEADRDAGPGQLARPDGAEAELTGAPTAPPGYAGEYLPAHLSRGDDAVALYAGRGATPLGGVYDRKGALRTKRDRGPWRELVIITAVAVIVSAVILAVTTAEKSNVAGLDSIFGTPRTTAGAASPSTTAGAATDSSPALSSTTPGTGLSAAPKPGTSAPLSQQPKSLPVTAGVAQSLVKSWLASNPGGYGMSPADVAGTVPNEVYYAVQPTTGTYWALAAFKPSPALSAQSSTETGQGELAEFHDSVYAFSWQAGPVWTLLGEFSTGSCPSVWVPRAVLAAWGLCGL